MLATGYQRQAWQEDWGFKDNLRLCSEPKRERGLEREFSRQIFTQEHAGLWVSPPGLENTPGKVVDAQSLAVELFPSPGAEFETRACRGLYTWV